MIDAYVAAFAARCEATRRPGQTLLRRPGLHGLLPCPEDRRVRLLVGDDAALAALAALLPEASEGMISVLYCAPGCRATLSERLGWAPDPATAMVCRDLRRVPSLPLTEELTLRQVRRRAGDPPGVPLEEAVALAVRASPALRERTARGRGPERFADYLRSLDPAYRLLAAVDAGGTVRATAGAATFGRDATVLFVNTDPEWRGRGIAGSMTAAALRCAADRGARRASLDSSRAGLGIYRRVGFETVGRTMRFLRFP